MKKSRRKFTSAFKAQVAIEALKERESLAELSNRLAVHPNMISKWKQEFLEKSAGVFDNKSNREPEVDPEKLYAQIGQLKVENLLKYLHGKKLIQTKNSTT
jgi:transposase